MGGPIYVLDTNILRGHLCIEDHWHEASEPFFDGQMNIATTRTARFEAHGRISIKVRRAGAQIQTDIKRIVFEEERGIEQSDIELHREPKLLTREEKLLRFLETGEVRA